MGDRNCDLQSQNFEATYLRDMVDGLALHLQPSPPIHHTATSDTWLDVVLVDDLEKIHNYTKSDFPFIAGHDLIPISYRVINPLPTNQVRHRRNYHQLDQTELDCSMQPDVQKLYGKFQTELHIHEIEQIMCESKCSIISTLYTLAPMKIVAAQKNEFSWVTVELKTKIKHRNRLYKLAKRTGSLLNYGIYRDFRNKLSSGIKNVKQQFIFNKLKSINNSITMA